MPERTPRISVIVPTKDRAAAVGRFIESLNRQTLFPLELVIVDAGSDSAEEAHRPQLHASIELRYLRARPGLTHQRNIGIDAAAGDFIAFFDDDIVLAPDFLAEAVAPFADPSAEDVAVVYGRIVNQPRPARRFVRIHARIGHAIGVLFFLTREGSGRYMPSGMPTAVMSSSVERETEYMPGGLTVYRRSVFDRFRFDEALEGYGYMEDDDMAYRISRSFRILYNPTASCQHLHVPGNRLTPRDAGRMLIVHHHYLFRKNFPQDLRHRLAHAWSLVGYPVQRAWYLDWGRARGGLDGIWLVARRQHPLVQVRDDASADI